MIDPIYAKPLRFLRKVYVAIMPNSSLFVRNWQLYPLKEYSNELIYNLLTSDEPTMIARIGSNEINCMANYIGTKGRKNIVNFIKGQSPAWWWEGWMMKQMNEVAGFFPKEIKYFERFSELMINDLKQVDLLGSWRKEEFFFAEELISTKKVMLEDLDPFFVTNPWTQALEGKTVLVVHPFAASIEKQYQKRKKLFARNVLPDFTLKTLKAVQSHGNEDSGFPNWFDALESMKNKIDNTDFDVCILGCGAYGFPLAAHIKRSRKKAIHLGGISQLLFGIKGKRYEGTMTYPYQNLYNEYWTRPGEEEKPNNPSIVEGACYW